MINKFSKRIILAPNFLKFIFLIKYLILLFFISTATFLIIPKFFDYKKDLIFINNQLINLYSIDIKKNHDVLYKVFPTPRLIIKNKLLIIGDNSEISHGNIILNLRLKDIYQIKNFKIDKVVIIKSNLTLSLNDYKNLLRIINSLEKKLIFKNLKLLINDKQNKLITIDNFNLLNEDVKKINFSGIYLGNKFSGKYLKKLDKNLLNFKINDLGISSKIIFTKKSNLETTEGKIKIKVLNSLIMFDFFIKDKIKISNSYLRNKNFSTSFDGFLILKPFFNFNLFFNIKNINQNFFDAIKIDQITKQKNILKNTNGSFNFTYSDNKKFKKDFIKEILLNIRLENGEVNIDNSKIYINGAEIDLNLNTYNTHNYPRLRFKLIFSVTDWDKFIKQFSKTVEDREKMQKLLVKGSINLISSKINFDLIKLNDSYEFNDEELVYFKKNFEEIVISDSLKDSLNKKKLKNFINEIY
jgi:hypothetical protein